MKKFYRLSLAAAVLVLSFSLFACSGDKPEDTAKAPADNIQTEAQSTSNGYESEKYNLKFTPPEGYVMFSDAEVEAQTNDSTTCEMISEHSDGFPHVMVITESSDAKTSDEYLENLRTSFSGEGFTTTEITDKEIAGRNFRTFTVTTSDGIVESFYAEGEGEYLCIAVITSEGGTGEDEVLSAFSAVK